MYILCQSWSIYKKVKENIFRGGSVCMGGGGLVEPLPVNQIMSKTSFMCRKIILDFAFKLFYMRLGMDIVKLNIILWLDMEFSKQ